MSEKSHWDQVYSGKTDEALGWFQRHPARSLALIEVIGSGPGVSVIDVGGGLSGLMAGLLSQGFPDLWLLDISALALTSAREKLGVDAARIQWVEGDVTKVELPPAHFDIWHDRAVFHFLTETAARAAYVEKACAAVKPGGHLIIATFAEDGPEQCSGLPVVRYDAASLQTQFAGSCELLRTEQETHRTPAGLLQRFNYFLLRRTVS